MKRKIKKLCIVLLSLIINVANAANQNIAQEVDTIQGVDKMSSQQLKAITLLNYYIYSLSKIASLDSKIVLQEEYDDINNNLSIASIVGFNEIKDLRIELLTELNSFIINEEEKQRALRLEERSIKNAGREAALNALSGVNVTINSFSAIANTAIGAARAALDYSLRTDAMKQQTDDTFWQLKKENMSRLTVLRSSYISKAYDLFDKYTLPENARLTERNAANLADITNELNMKVRLQRLLDNQKVFNSFAPYWYYLGDAYMCLNNYEKGFRCFDQYEVLYNETPVYKTNKILGQISLYRLNHISNLNNEERFALIDQVEKNMGDNSDALLFCAYDYIQNKMYKQAISLIRRCLINPKMGSKEDGMLLLIKLINEDPKIISEYKNDLDVVTEALQNCPSLDLCINMAYCATIDPDNPSFWTNIGQISVVNKIERNKIMPNTDRFLLQFPKSLDSNKSLDKLYGINTNDLNKITSYTVIPSKMNIWKLKKIKSEFPTLIITKDKNDNYEDLNVIFNKLNESDYQFKRDIDWDYLSVAVSETEKDKLKERHKSYLQDPLFYFDLKKSKAAINESFKTNGMKSKQMSLYLNAKKNKPINKINIDGDDFDLLILPYGAERMLIVLEANEQEHVKVVGLIQTDFKLFRNDNTNGTSKEKPWIQIINSKFNKWYEKHNL